MVPNLNSKSDPNPVTFHSPLTTYKIWTLLLIIARVLILSESLKEKAELRSAVENNLQNTQALITNISFLKSALPVLTPELQEDAPILVTKSYRSNRGSAGLLPDMYENSVKNIRVTINRGLDSTVL